MEELFDRIANRIRNTRLALGLSQQALASRARLHVSYVNQIERRRRDPSVAALKALADALDLKLSTLVAADSDSPFSDEMAVLLETVPEEDRPGLLELVRGIIEFSR